MKFLFIIKYKINLIKYLNTKDFHFMTYQNKVKNTLYNRNKTFLVKFQISNKNNKVRTI